MNPWIIYANMILVNILLGYFVSQNWHLKKKIDKLGITVDFLYHKLGSKNENRKLKKFGSIRG